MRKRNSKESIDYNRTKGFFDRRVSKFNKDNPYGVTMYQDNHPELVLERNKKETEKLLPKLELKGDSKVFDFACGIGRWSDAIQTEVYEYCGVDFCEGLINIAKERNLDKNNRYFYVGSAKNFVQVLGENGKDKYDRILMIGALIYINDDDLRILFEGIEDICKENAIICIREPIGVKERLTLREEFSEELHDEYNVIYRTRDEIKTFLTEPVLNKGFHIVEEGFMFDDVNLNNRKETSQYYFILKRGD